MPTKVCNYCLQDLDISFFHAKKNGKYGVRAQCVECVKKYAKINKKNINEYYKSWCINNPEKVQEKSKKYAQKNKGLLNAKNIKRKTTKLKATPKWANLIAIKAKYQLAAMFNKETEQRWHVDHIVPLKGKNVCGLHVEYNLRVIPAKENLKKSNRFDI